MTIQSSLAGAAFFVLAALTFAMPAVTGADAASGRSGALILAQASGSSADRASANDAEAARIKSEEESFMKLLAEQRRQEAEEKATAEAAKKAAAERAEAERIAKEEETFMKLLSEQRRQEAEEKARAEAAKKAAAEKAEAERIAKEEETFMKLLAEQRRQEAEAKKAAAEAKRKEAAAICEKRLSKVGRSGTIQFASGRAEITAESKALLDRLAAAAAACEEGLSIQVDGHTDATGPEDLNQRLSEQRAQSVATYLVSKGIAADRVTSRGYGESQPIADNATRPGRAKNRRIEFKVD